MAGLFLTTAALEIYLLWPTSPLSRFIASAPVSERWVSPLSHAILQDTLMTSRGDTLALKKGLRLVEEHRRSMRFHEAQYPCPDQEAIRIWSEIRGIAVDIPAFEDGVARYPAQRVGPDELLVFATAAAFSKPLVGPMPVDADTLEYLNDLGVRFEPVMRISG